MEKWKKQRRIRTKQILGIFAVVLIISIISMAGIATAKSVYLSANHHTKQFDAWNINPDGTVTKVATYILKHSTDPSGIAIDAVPKDAPVIFITSEFSGGVEMVNPITLEYMGVSSGPSDLAGIDVDDVDNIVYTLRRQTNDLYIYSWDPVAKKLTQQAVIDLPGMSYGFGIALDDSRDILWVSDTPNYMVRAYDVDVSTWSDIVEIPSLSFKVSHRPIDVTVDKRRNLVYTVGGWYGSRLLTKYDVATATETTKDLGVGGIGVAVDEVTGYVYVTRGTSSAGDDIQVWDTSTSPFTLLQDTPRIGNPAGICIPQEEIAVNPLGFSKDDRLAEDECVNVGAKITYDICYNNTANDFDVHNVTIVDNLPPETSFVSATGGGTYDPGTHTVTWDIGTLIALAPQACVELVVQVDPATTPGIKVTNYATIDGEETRPKTPTTVTEQTDVCVPKAELCPDEYRWNTSINPKGYEWDPFPTLFRAWNDVHFVNNGTGDAYNVIATITCAPVNVNIIDGNVTFGDIPAGGSAWSKDFFLLEVDMTNPQGPDKGICWRVEYDDVAGAHHVIEDVPKFCGENCSDICP